MARSKQALILCQWTPCMQLLKISLTFVFVWIKLHNLPMEFWTTTCLSFIASGVGKPLCANSTTEEQRRLGFARVLVEVNTDSDFPKEIEITNYDGLPVNIGVEYPWLPVQCKTCKSFGHATHACTKVAKQAWVPRVEPSRREGNRQKVPLVQKAEVKHIEANGKADKQNQWTLVQSAKKTPMAKAIADDGGKHWSNSFHLLARADGHISRTNLTRDSSPFGRL